MGNRIKELRKNNNLTLKQLGSMVGLATNTISQYETGDRNPKLETWIKMSEIFDVPVSYLQGVSNDCQQQFMTDAEQQKRLDKLKIKFGGVVRKAYMGEGDWEEIYADFKRQWNLLEVEISKREQDACRVGRTSALISREPGSW